MRSLVRRPALLLAAAAVPGFAFAHSFGVQYTLPVHQALGFEAIFSRLQP